MAAQFDWKEIDNQYDFLKRSKQFQPLIQHVIEHQLLSEEKNNYVIDVFDLDRFDERIEDLLSAFPEEHVTHALAIKSQPLAGILKHVITKFPRLGLECASIGEAWLAYELGTNSERIVYDSPVKTKRELEIAIKHGFHINSDNSTEMEMIDEILKKPGMEKTKSTFGLRINPLVGEGGIAMSSTAGKASKFGLIYCDETFKALVKIFTRYSWLKGVHCHVGSQGCSLDLLSNGAVTIYQAAEKLNEALGKQQVDTLDIGGGVPTSYHSDTEALSFRTYREALEKKVPDFFAGKYRVITEFGRSVFAKYCTTLTFVSSVKGSDLDSDDDFVRLRGQQKGNAILLTHVGSNAFLREAYQLATSTWRRRFTVFNKDGTIKENPQDEFRAHDVAGPLCFQGDYIAKDVWLPKDIQLNDILAIHDTGGYTYALYSHYNSRSPHAVYTAKKDGNGGFLLECIKREETIKETISFWNYEQYKK